MSIKDRLRRVEAKVALATPEPEPEFVPVSPEHARLAEECRRAGERFLALSREHRRTDPDSYNKEVIEAARYCRDLDSLELHLIEGTEPPDYLVERLAKRGVVV